MCRSFTDRPVPDEFIERLLYAANRSPAAGNVRTSEIIIIKDEFTIEEIKKVSPGFGGICPLLLAISTDKTSTEEYDVASFDAGTIAENIALAATDIGLGICLLKSYPDKIVQKILRIPPDKAKLEILVCVGYPARSRAETKTRSLPLRLYEESYANPKSSYAVFQHSSDRRKPDSTKATDLSTPDASAQEQVIDSPSSLFDLALFILTSARSTIDESSRYGPKRLVDTLIGLLDIPRASFAQKVESDDEFLDSIRAELRKRTDLRSSSTVYTQEFKDFLDDLIERFVTQIEKQRKP